MNTNPLVSVVVPVYNKGNYLLQAMESILCQSYDKIEIIVVDDNSTDNSLDIINNLQLSDNRIQLIKHSVNMGVADTRNDGIKAANGEYIALIDADDLWVQNKIEKQLELILSTKADIVYCSYGFINWKNEILDRNFLVSKCTNLNSFLSKSVFSCSTIFYRADIAKKFKFDSSYYHEDFVLWCTLLSEGYSAVGDEEILAYYRISNNSKTANKLKSSKHRWIAYRKVLKLGFFKSLYYYTKYIINGIRKYL